MGRRAACVIGTTVLVLVPSCVRTQPAPVAEPPKPPSQYILPWFAPDRALFCLEPRGQEPSVLTCRPVWELREWMRSAKAN